MYPIVSALRRHALPLVAVLFALALIVGATHELGDVLAFDWSATGADVTAAPEVVQLP